MAVTRLSMSNQARRTPGPERSRGTTPWLSWVVASVLVTALVGPACGSKERSLAPIPDPPDLPDGTGGSAAIPGGGAGAAGSAGASGAAGSGSAGMAGSAPDIVTPSCIPRAPCQTLCGALALDPAECGVGNDAQCGCICEERFNGPCPDELSALLACTGESPSVDCATRGRIFAGCENESIALELCDFRAREALCADVFPRCTPYCRAAALSFCPQGPESVTSCLCGCEATLASTCENEFEAFMNCASDAPQFSCSTSGLPEPASCPSEWQALEGCASQFEPSPRDAG